MATGQTLRLCLCLEVTARQAGLWQQTLKHVIEPVLAMLEAQQAACELALVLFSAPPPFATATVESSAWVADVPTFRRLLEGLRFVGGGRQPVALAEALAEAAALFSLPPSWSGGGTAAWQQHCLVCFASEPSMHPVPWPYPEDCAIVSLGCWRRCFGSASGAACKW